MTIDLWADEPLPGESPQDSVVEVDEQVYDATGHRLPEGYSTALFMDEEFLYLVSDEDLSHRYGFDSLYKLSHELEGDVWVTKVLPRRTNAVTLRSIMPKGAFLQPRAKSYVVEESSAMARPRAYISETGRHIEVKVPNLKHYSDMMKKLSAYPAKGAHRIQLGKALDLIALNEGESGRFPKIKIEPDVLELNEAPIAGFDGTVESLKTIPLDELHVISANVQTAKSLKQSKKTLSEKFAEFGISSLYDLMFRLPRRYIDKSDPQEIEDLIEGESATILGTVTESSTMGGMGGAKFTITTESGQRISVVFFRQDWLRSKFFTGSEVVVTGKYSPFMGKPSLGGVSIDFAEEAGLLPIVPVYKQSPSKGITTMVMLSATRELISRLRDVKLPPYLEKEGRPSYSDTLREIHFPTSLKAHSEAISSLAYYELVMMQVQMLQRRLESRPVPGISQKGEISSLQRRAIESLPFDLTDSQSSAVEKLNDSLASEMPSATLLSADVGSGKGLLPDEFVLTPLGWREVGLLRPGDLVVGRDGQPTRVIGVFPQPEQAVARVTLRDGSSLVTDLHHLWTLIDDDGNEQLLSTGDLLELQASDFGLPLMRPLDCTREKPALNPAVVAKLLLELPHPGEVPTNIAFASLEYRQAVVRALSAGCTDFVLDLHESARDSVANLVRSVGGAAMTISNSLHCSLPGGSLPSRRVLRSVELLPETAATVCIKVEAEDELFVVRDYMVTHNTVVAELACLRAVDSGRQAILVAPTNILANQLHRTLQQLVAPLTDEEGNAEVRVGYIYGGMPAKERNAVKRAAKSGEVDIVVGGLALLNKTISYKNLGFICLDEQQKFGAEARTEVLSSRSDGRQPDLMMQSATPVPRSTSQVLYGEMDLVELRDKPKGRLPIRTEWIRQRSREAVKQKIHPMWADIMREADAGRQTFVLTPLVTESPNVDAASVESTFHELSKLMGEERVRMVHGRMAPDVQEQTMLDFRAGEFSVLVASTVVEVGVDIPLATRVVILSADRFGAAGLHQIRGRVGRNDLQSKCYLVAETENEQSIRRLQAMVDYNDGFEIAKIDLETRGEGSMFGSQQSGASELIFASLRNHSDKIPEAIAEAELILKSDFRDMALNDSRLRFDSEERLY